MTYGELFDKLRELDYVQHEIELDGKPRYLFEHKTSANALIVLPERDRGEQVEPFHLNSVLTTLKAHGLLPKCNPLRT
jgi:hypothetical protein